MSSKKRTHHHNNILTSLFTHSLPSTSTSPTSPTSTKTSKRARRFSLTSHNSPPPISMPSFLASLPPVTSTITNPPSSPLTSFYLSLTPDHRRRTLRNLLELSDEEMEYLHDYIQWLFPLPEESGFNWNAPVITETDATAFRGCDKLRGNLGKSWRRFCKFLGLRVVDTLPSAGVSFVTAEEEGDGAGQEEVEVDKEEEEEGLTLLVTRAGYKIYLAPSVQFKRAARNWWTPFSHNHLRITRIIRSLRVLGLEEEAGAFFEALKRAKEVWSGGPGEKSFEFWGRAVKRPLEVRPDDEDYHDVSEEEEDSGNETEESEEKEKDGKEEEVEDKKMNGEKEDDDKDKENHKAKGETKDDGYNSTGEKVKVL